MTTFEANGFLIFGFLLAGSRCIGQIFSNLFREVKSRSEKVSEMKLIN